MAKKYAPPHYKAGLVIDKLVFSAVSTAEEGSQLRDTLTSGTSKSKKTRIGNYIFDEEKDNNNRYAYTFNVFKKKEFLGVLTIDHIKRKNYDDYAFTVENVLHYLPDGAMPPISMFLHDFDLRLRKIIQLDIAIDHYKHDPQKVFWSRMKNPASRIIIKRRAYELNDYIPAVEIISSGTRNKRDHFTTTYIKQQDGSSKKALVLYNKLAEIETTSNKDYIPKYHLERETDIDQLHRAEIRTGSKYIRQYEKSRKMDIDLEFLFNHDCLHDYYLFHLNRLVKITDSKGRVNDFIKKPYKEYRERVEGGGKKEVETVIMF